jgi:hypothetical protein
MEAAEGSGGGQRLWRGSKGSGGSKQEALEAVGGGQRLSRRSEALEEVEGCGGSKHEALETAGSSGDGRRLLWR